MIIYEFMNAASLYQSCGTHCLLQVPHSEHWVRLWNTIAKNNAFYSMTLNLFFFLYILSTANFSKEIIDDNVPKSKVHVKLWSV